LLAESRCHEPATFLRYEGAVTGTLADSGEMDDVLLPPRFTYASDELGLSGQGVIRPIEWATGQPRIRRMYERYTQRGRPPELFWHDAIAELRLDLRVSRRPADAIPASGPLMVVANHPFGVVDGIILCWLVAQARPDYQIMTHRVLHQAPEVRSRILPVDFSGTDAATRNNLRSRRQARELLDKSGALLVFPGGGVAAAPNHPPDPALRPPVPRGPQQDRPPHRRQHRRRHRAGAAACPRRPQRRDGIPAPRHPRPGERQALADRPNDPDHWRGCPVCYCLRP